MKPIYFTVGPTQLHPKMEEFLRDALREGILSMSHRGSQFTELYRHVTDSLRKLLDIPADSHIFFLGSATEAMERFIENCVEKTSFHIVNGAFAERFFKTAADLKKNALHQRFEAGEAFDLSKIVVPDEAEVVCITHNETSNGYKIPESEIHALKRKYPDKLFAVDIVSSVPDAKLDFSLIDCAFFSVQKGFGLPAGLGVLIVNERCIQKSLALQKQGLNIGSFHNFPIMLKFETKSQTPETPNVLAMYLLGRVCDDYLGKGMDAIRKETEEKAAVLYDFFDGHAEFKPFIKDVLYRSMTTLEIETRAGSADVIKKCAEQGLVVASGYKDLKDAHIRIGNFPAHSKEDVQRLLDVLSKT